MQATESDKSILVVGNGPSLKSFDFETLRSKTWLGMNAAYRHWQRINLYPTYFCCLDGEVGRSHLLEIVDMISRADALGIKQFLLDDSIIDAGLAGGHTCLNSERLTRASSLFGGDPELSDRVTTGSHSVFWAASLGYVDLTLLGIDQDYDEDVAGLAQRGGSRLEVVEHTQSPNYYFEDYQRVGDRLNSPNPIPNVHASAWRRVMRRIKSDFPDIRVANASPVSSLPGTITAAEPNGASPPEPNSLFFSIDVLIPDQMTLMSALNQLLPSRFVELSNPERSLPDRAGLAWKKIPEEHASNRGRWHLVVRAESNGSPQSPLNLRTHNPLSSVIYIHDARTQRAHEDWAAIARDEFDQFIRILSEDGSRLIATLALRLDILPQNLDGALIPKAGWLSRMNCTLKRIMWRSARRLDRFRSNRF